ncbi:MAG: hypothetical protein IJU45_02975 [Clostridia bacterium]|nr:hypothetical protein [Clostridia bacterium]
MEYINLFGLAFMAVIMIPNIICAVKNKDAFKNKYNNKVLTIIELIGRIGCFVFMIFHVPGLKIGWRSKEAFVVYLIVDCVLVIAYCALWAVLFKKNSMFKALVLSVIPSVLFLFSGIISNNLPLIISAVLFAPAHVFISYKNAA